MNKTFTAAVAVAAIAGLVSAEIATAPAGYVESDVAGAAQYVCNPFGSFTGNDPTLGDLDGSNLNYGTDKIIIIGANGKKLFTAKYLPSGEEGAGWYEYTTGVGYGGCSNTFPLARGTAVQFSGEGAITNKLVMAGTLDDTDVETTLQSGYNFVGNVSAVATNLNAVTLGGDSYKYANDYLVLDGKKYVYLPEKKGSYEAGWYFRDYLLLGKTGNGVTAGLVAPALAPGKGFYVYTKKSGATICIRAK